MRDKAEGLRTMLESGILLVIRQDSADAVLRIIDAVVRGGVKVIEITLTVPNALDIVKAAVKEFGTDILIGAGQSSIRRQRGRPSSPGRTSSSVPAAAKPCSPPARGTPGSRSPEP